MERLSYSRLTECHSGLTLFASVLLTCYYPTEINNARFHVHHDDPLIFDTKLNRIFSNPNFSCHGWGTLCLLFLASQIQLFGQGGKSTLNKNLSNLWDGTWVRTHLDKKQDYGLQLETLNAALSIYKREFHNRSAVEREWQLAEIRSVLNSPKPSLQSDFPEIFDHLSSLSKEIVEEYTQIHESLFDRDTEWERLRSQVFIDFEGENLRSGELLARAINYVLGSKAETEEDELRASVFSVIERRIQDYLFAFNNGTATNRRQIHTVWNQKPVSLLPPGNWGLSESASKVYEICQASYLLMVAKFQIELENAFKNPKFVARLGVSTAVADILQLLSENYFEFATYSRWFSENETLMNEALIIVDMRTRATPHEVVKLDPLTLKPTDLNEGQYHSDIINKITEKRRELLLRYLAIREEVNGEIKEEIIRRKKDLSPEEEEVLWREYQKMRDLTISATSTP